MIDPKTLVPSQAVLDLVFTYADTLGRGPGHALVSEDHQLVLHGQNHLGQPFMFGVPVHFAGDPVLGAQPRFVLRRLGPGVWKLAPSVQTDRVHAYVTLVDAPDPAPWETFGLEREDPEHDHP